MKVTALIWALFGMALAIYLRLASDLLDAIDEMEATTDRVERTVDLLWDKILPPLPVQPRCDSTYSYLRCDLARYHEGDHQALRPI